MGTLFERGQLATVRHLLQAKFQLWQPHRIFARAKLPSPAWGGAFSALSLALRSRIFKAQDFSKHAASQMRIAPLKCLFLGMLVFIFSSAITCFYTFQAIAPAHGTAAKIIWEQTMRAGGFTLTSQRTMSGIHYILWGCAKQIRHS